MSLFKTFTRFLFLTLILFTSSKNIVFADGGFPVRPGRLLIAPSVSYFFSSTQWDSTGVKKPFPNGGKYSSVGVTLYTEYGISRRFAAIVSVPYVYNNYMQNIAPRNTVTSGLTDMETGIRYYLANIDFVYYFSLQGTAVTPLYSNNASLGYGEEGAELKLAFSGTGTLFNRSTYFNAADGVRQYFGLIRKCSLSGLLVPQIYGSVICWFIYNYKSTALKRNFFNNYIILSISIPKVSGIFPLTTNSET